MQAPSSKLPPSPSLSHHYGNPASSVPGTESPWSWETPQSKADWDTLFAIILLSRQGQKPFSPAITSISLCIYLDIRIQVLLVYKVYQ